MAITQAERNTKTVLWYEQEYTIEFRDCTYCNDRRWHQDCKPGYHMEIHTDKHGTSRYCIKEGYTIDKGNFAHWYGTLKREGEPDGNNTS